MWRVIFYPGCARLVSFRNFNWTSEVPVTSTGLSTAISILTLHIFVFVFSACKTRDRFSEVRVVNGRSETDFPYVVQITMNGKGKCTGSFVSPSLMVTAAHCVQSAMHVEFGEIRVERDQIFIHPDWPTGGEACNRRGEPASDVALIRFPDQTYRGPEFARLAAVAPVAGDEIKIVGFGHNEIKMFPTYCRLDASGADPAHGCVLRKGKLTRGVDYEFEQIFSYPLQEPSPDFDGVGCPVRCSLEGLASALAAENRDWKAILEHDCAGNFRDRPYSESGVGTKRSGMNRLGFAGRGIFKFYGQLSDANDADLSAEAASGAGDSGGPLLSHSSGEWFLAGVTHGGTLVMSGDGVEKASIYVDLNSRVVRPWLELISTQENLAFPGLVSSSNRAAVDR